MNDSLRSALDRAAGEPPDLDLRDVWARGRARRRRRHAVQAVGGLTGAGALVAALWLGGGVLDHPDALPGPAKTPTDDPAVTSVARESVPETTTQEAATQEATTPEATSEAPTTLPVDPCTTPYPDPVLRDEGLPEAARETAAQVLALAAECDLDGLGVLAQQDQTFVSFGVVDPEQAFSGAEGAERAAAITVLMTTFAPGQDAADAPYGWPGTVGTDEQWQQVVDAELYTQGQVDLMRDSGTGYSGWRVGVDARGRWSFMVAGD